jgi:hypothetical protein
MSFPKAQPHHIAKQVINMVCTFFVYLFRVCKTIRLYLFSFFFYSKRIDTRDKNIFN